MMQGTELLTRKILVFLLMLLCSNSPVFGLNKCSRYLWREKEEHRERVGMTVRSRLAEGAGGGDILLFAS